MTSTHTNLLRTTDGEHWGQVGTIAEHYGDYAFTSPNNGVYVEKEKIFQTQDSGKTWTPVFACETKAEVDGLARNLRCHLGSVHFPSTNVGYALGETFLGPKAAFVVKTEDGGATWSVVDVMSGESGHDGTLCFVSDTAGFMRVLSGKLFRTTDGGKTWNGVVASAGKRITFAAGRVGWSFAYRKLAYTTDGGEHWSSREFAFPAPVNAFCLPKPDRGYAVGDHGMVYRYRIVPIDYAAKGMIDAPGM